MSFDVDIAIVGGGVIGCALAYELSRDGDRSICLIEKNERIAGENQSSRSSGVIHAGIYYPSEFEPLKARLCVEGNRMLYDFCEKHNVPFARTGKIVVAAESYEEEYLDDLLRTSIENGVHVRRISGEEVRSMEPNVNALCALHVPDSGIVEATSLVRNLYQQAEHNGVMFLAGTRVIGIHPGNDYFDIAVQPLRGEEETFRARTLLNAAGLFADDVAKFFNPDFPFTIQPVRGESAKFYKSIRPELFTRMNVYPAPYGYFNDTGEKAGVPFPEFLKLMEAKKITRTVGVHLTPTFDIDPTTGEYITGNTVNIGPVKTVGIGKEDYASGLKSENVYFNAVKNFFPHLKINDIGLHQAGIMAVPVGHRDFVIERDRNFPNAIHFIIDSPGLTSALAIARYVKTSFFS
ncbi:MAG: NAD(P)/FAD-dependent oxidoreductase [Candidatus Omnitrophota bacterium]